MKYRPGSKSECNKCNFSADDSIDVKTHKMKKHLPQVSTSTRDNSVLAVMNEDISAIDVQEESDESSALVTLDESIKKKHIEPMCGQVFEEESDSMKPKQIVASSY